MMDYALSKSRSSMAMGRFDLKNGDKMETDNKKPEEFLKRLVAVDFNSLMEDYK